ncbi:unnamed protein product [Arctogadus glacialis]
MSKGGTGVESPLLQALWVITQTQEIQAYDGQTQQTMLDLAAHHAEESVVFHDLQRRMTRQALRIVLPTIGADKDILEAFLEVHLRSRKRVRDGPQIRPVLAPIDHQCEHGSNPIPPKPTHMHPTHSQFSIPTHLLRDSLSPSRTS